MANELKKQDGERKRRPGLEDQVFVENKIRCPYCGTSEVRNNGKRRRAMHYRCKVCVDPATGFWTTFKVGIKAGSEPKILSEQELEEHEEHRRRAANK